jgi:glucose/arabinose dehydrogenase
MQSILSHQNPLSNTPFGRASRAVGLCVLLGLVFTAVLSVSATVTAATLPSGFTESTVASGLSAPTAMAFAPDGRLFVCQQGGQLRVIKNGVLLGPAFVTVSTTANGERGLLGVAFDPNFVVNQFVYVYYTAATPATHNRVSRFTASGDVAMAGETIIFDIDNLSGATNHNGGAIHFGPDGKLYIDVGENANPSNSQSIGNLLGKVLRINSDGTIPADNPTSFPGIAGSPAGNNRAIWAVGLRNPYTFTFQPGSGRMFINDVGQSAWEEIDDGIAGSNYGWSVCEGFCSPANANFRDPLFEYGHGSSSTTGCAITGGAFYNPTTATFPSDYIGKYFFAEFCTGWIRRFDPTTGTTVAFATGISAPVDLKVTDDGSLYYLSNGSGSVFRVQFSNPTSSNGIVVGRLTNGSGASIEGATIRLTGSQTRKTVTDTNGNYRFDNVSTTGTYTLTPSRANYSFSPFNRSFSPVSSSTDASFTATFNSDTANPLDTPEYFVRQQYVDVLGREPDESGFNYWSDQILACAGDTLCVNTRRRDVGAAFFIEQEFQLTGSFLYDAYAAALGRKPVLAEYSVDRQQLVGGTNLDSAKTAFAQGFVQRAEFTTKYQSNTTAASFVDALLQTVQAVGVNLNSERANLIGTYNGAGNTVDSRAAVLRSVADNTTFKQAQYNPAFVLTEYFSYLKRDADQLGYNFWLNVLNNGDVNNYRGMVCSFITSTEYQRRFSNVVSHGNGECGQ